LAHHTAFKEDLKMGDHKMNLLLPLSSKMTASFFLILIVLILIPNPTWSEEFHPVIDESSASDLFSIAPEIQVIGPTQFPKPTRMLNDTAVVVVEPTFGTHRYNQDVVMAYAEGYSLPYYIMFIETLRKTGFTGDIVLAIAHYSLLADHVEEYLRQSEHVVVYIHEMHCYESDGITPSPRLMKGGALDIFQMCHLQEGKFLVGTVGSSSDELSCIGYD
jgi:hypothetical protein